MRYLIAVLLSAFLLSSCYVGLKEARSVSLSFDAQKAAIEERARTGHITWVDAMILQRDLDKSLVANANPIYGFGISGPLYRTSWKYDRDDEEYYAFCIANAEQLDKSIISYSQFDYMRIQKKNDVDRSRELLEASQQSAAAARESARPKTCTSTPDLTGTVTTNCR